MINETKIKVSGKLLIMSRRYSVRILFGYFWYKQSDDVFDNETKNDIKLLQDFIVEFFFSSKINYFKYNE